MWGTCMAYLKYQCKMEQEYREMAELIPKVVIRMFEYGGHPAIATNAEKAAEIISEFAFSHIV